MAYLVMTVANWIFMLVKLPVFGLAVGVGPCFTEVVRTHLGGGRSQRHAHPRQRRDRVG